MTIKTRLGTVLLCCAAGVLLAGAGLGPAVAQQDEPAQEERKPEYSKGFLKGAGKVQKDLQAAKWQDVLAGVQGIEGIEDLTQDDRRALLSWKLKALQELNQREELIKLIEAALEAGLASPEQVGPWHRLLSATYSGRKDNAKTLLHFQAFIDATPDATAEEYATLGRLYYQVENDEQSEKYLARAVDMALAAGERPDEIWFALLDRFYLERSDLETRAQNLEKLTRLYPKRNYYTALLDTYQRISKDDKTLMLAAYRLVSADAGLERVGDYLDYASLAQLVGSPGEAQRALERGMAEGIVPQTGSPLDLLQEAKAAAARDRRDLAKDAQAAQASAGTSGEVHTKIGLGFYSIGEYDKAVDSLRRGLGKGGVRRMDDANILLGAALLEQGRKDEAKAAFAEAAGAAGPGSYMARVAGLWSALAERKGAAPAAQ